MTSSGAHSFDTRIGRCAIEWRGGLCVRVHLPGGEEHRDNTMPPAIEALTEAIACAAAGHDTDFAASPLDWSGVEPFRRDVYRLCAAISKGRVRTYGDMARELGDVGLSRAVGAALGANPFPVVIPCHRVIASGGGWGGFSAPEGLAAKRRLLDIEGAFGVETLPLFGTRDSVHAQ
jgi:methylated-DNA-[protein]-cysteine S-methyltransferase